MLETNPMFIPLSLGELLQFDWIERNAPKCSRSNSILNSARHHGPSENDFGPKESKEGYYFQRYAEKLGKLSDDSVDVLTHVEFNNCLASYE